MTSTHHKICCFYCGRSLGDVSARYLFHDIRLLAFCGECDPFLHSDREAEIQPFASFGVPKYSTFDPKKWEDFINSNFL